RIENDVSKDNRIKAQPNIVIPTLQNLALHQDETLLGEMFFNILRNSVDKTKQRFLSPAFPKILEQISKDEAEILTLLKMYLSIDCIYYMRANENGIYEEEYIEISHHINKEFFAIYKNHLTLLGLLTGNFYQTAEIFFEIDGNLVLQNSTQGREIFKNQQHENYKSVGKYFYKTEFNAFGKAFAEVCISKRCEEFLKC
ncbi:Abi-alpha family protein, partial [Helicobacter typhlonius]